MYHLYNTLNTYVPILYYVRICLCYTYLWADSWSQSMHKVTLTQLRSDIYRIVDEVLKTGEPIELERKGKKLRLVPLDKPGKLANLTPHPDAIVGDPEDLVEIDWSSEWNEKDNL
jgi:antitoxin (DNA-binding transcriptional repressor) of toxin-antitoxin stability system